METLKFIQQMDLQITYRYSVGYIGLNDKNHTSLSFNKKNN